MDNLARASTEEVPAVIRDMAPNRWWLEGRLRRAHGDARAVAVAPAGDRAVSASADGTLHVWDLTTGQKSYTLQRHEKAVSATAFTVEGDRAVSASRCGSEIWEPVSNWPS